MSLKECIGSGVNFNLCDFFLQRWPPGFIAMDPFLSVSMQPWCSSTWVVLLTPSRSFATPALWIMVCWLLAMEQVSWGMLAWVVELHSCVLLTCLVWLDFVSTLSHRDTQPSLIRALRSQVHTSLECFVRGQLSCFNLINYLASPFHFLHHQNLHCIHILQKVWTRL